MTKSELINLESLCLSLVKAESEPEVIEILEKTGFWDCQRKLGILRRYREQLSNNRKSDEFT